jgi:selenide,water dikinase
LPGGTTRNFESYGHKLAPLSDEQRAVLCDPQTSGGLLVAVRPEQASAVEAVLAQHELPCCCIGELVATNTNNSARIEVLA